jgi:hypothetical protein
MFRFEFGKVSVRITAGSRAVLPEAFPGIPQSLQANAGEYLDWATTVSFRMLSNSLLTIHHTTRHYAVQILTN